MRDLSWTGLAASLALAACAPPAAPASVALKPLEERRAAAVIARVLEEHGAKPNKGRTFELGGGFRLKEEARVGEGPYGVAYVTAEERDEAAAQLPKYDPESTTLRILHPTPDAIVLVVHDLAYRFNPDGTDTATAVTAEKTLERDVADFMVNVVATGAGRKKAEKATAPRAAEDER